MTFRAPAVAALIGVSLLAAPLLAQSTLTRTTWRQRGRTTEVQRSPQRFALELRFGPYLPEVDEEFGGDGPFRRVFGDDPRLLVGAELDWQALRLPHVGSVGPGLGWSYTLATASALVSGTTTPSGESTSLMVMPMHLSAVLRVDGPARRFRIPLVPYAKAGLGLGIWSAGRSGSVPEIDGRRGEGLTWGTHLAAGIMFDLTFLPGSEARLDESTGVNHAYVFAEWMSADLDGLGSRPQMHVGDRTWVLGLALEM